MNYETPNIDIARLMAQGKSASQIKQATTAPAIFQLYGNMSAIPQYENRITCADGITRFGLPRTRIDTPKPLYNQSAAGQYVQIMENVLTEMGCQAVTSGTYPQRGDHVACTTRMASTDAEGVVNPDFQVWGVDNLYIVSNSVMPTLPAANPTLTLIAMAFKLLENNEVLNRPLKYHSLE